jgi:hypothetical protein
MMNTLASQFMEKIYGEDIYRGYQPDYERDIQGWNSNSPVFRQLISAEKISVIFDVGVWKGASTISLASLLKEFAIDGAVISVDTFLGSPEHWNRHRPDGIFSNLRLDRGYPQLYFQFLSNIVRTGNQKFVVPLPQTSVNAAKILGSHAITADLIHIDAAHEHDPVLNDARIYWNLLNPGGYLVGDDFHPTWPGVISAAEQFTKEVGASLEVHGPKWMVKKPAGVDDGKRSVRAPA